MSEKSLEEKIKAKQQQDMQDLAQQLGGTAADSPPDTSPVTPLVATETDPAAGAAKPKPKFFADAVQERPTFSREKIDGSKKETEPVDVPPTVIPKPDAEPVIPKPENITPEKTLEELKADLDAKRAVYAKVDLDASRKWLRLKNLLGAGIKEVSDEDFSKAFHDYNRAWQEYLEAKRGDVLKKGDKESAREFLREFEGADEAIKFLNLKYDLKKEQSGYPAKILYGFEKLANGWKEMSWKKKIAVSATVFGVGALAGITGGASFGLIGATAFTLRTFQRALGAGAMYIGAKKWQDQRSLGKMNEEINVKLDALMNSDPWLEKIKNLESGFSMKSTQNFFENKKKVEALDRKHKKRALALAGLIGVGGTTYDTLRTFFPGVGANMWNNAKEKMLGSVIFTSSVSAEHASMQGLGGGAAATQAVEHLQPSGGGMPQDLSPEDYARIQKAMASSGGSLQNWAETTHAAGAEVQTPEIAKPKFEEIAAVKIKPGGSMWGSIENNIKANPAAYGLDPNDPGFTKDMHRMTQQMLDEFAYRKGMSYEQLDQIARTKIRAGDAFKIIHDPSTRGIYIDDFHGKAFGADVSPGGASAAVQEVAPSKPGMSTVDDVKPRASVAPEDATKPRAGAAAEQPTRARGGQTRVPQELTPQQRTTLIAQADQELAARYPDEVAANARELARNNHQLYLANRPLLGNIFHKFGISEYYNIYDQPMSKWNDLIGTGPNIAQDVSQADAINSSNEAWKKLNDLHSMLKYYNTSGHETIGECLRLALEDSRIGRSGGSIGAEVQQAINEILGNKK